jgi:aerobic C4-dicarboxylate transport protein
LTLLLGVERFMSEIRAVTNLFSNIFATLVVAKSMGELNDQDLQLALTSRRENLGTEAAHLAGSAQL